MASQQLYQPQNPIQRLHNKDPSILIELLQVHNTYLTIESNLQLRKQQKLNQSSSTGTSTVGGISNESDEIEGNTNVAKNGPSLLPTLSTDFPISENLQHIHTSKINEVKSAFNHAAYCLLRSAIYKQQKLEQNKDPLAKNFIYEDSVDLSALIHPSSSKSERQYTSMIANIMKLAQIQQKEEDEINEKKQKILSEKHEKLLKPQSSSAPSSSSTIKKTKIGSGVTLSASSTKASSSMVDSRATVARAILCAAANVAFSELTPDLHDGDYCTNRDKKNRKESPYAIIDHLNVPQNTHYRKEAHTNTSLEQKKKEAGDTEKDEKDDNSSTSVIEKKPVVNMGAVMMQAKILGKRAISYALAASRRARERHRFAVESTIQQKLMEKALTSKSIKDQINFIGSESPKSTNNPLMFLNIPNPFGFAGNDVKVDKSNTLYNDSQMKIENEYPNLFDRAYDPSYPLFNDELVTASKLQRDRDIEMEERMLTDYWRNTCLKRMKEIVNKGMGNMIYNDMEWDGRAVRIADFLRHLAVWGDEVEGIEGQLNLDRRNSILKNFGPHLIVTSESEMKNWESAFPKLGFFKNHNGDLEPMEYEDDETTNGDEIALRALIYVGPSKARRRLRRHLRFMVPIVNNNTPSRCISGPPSVVSTKDAQFHVVITSYQILIRDFVHLCKIPWQVVVLDDGVGWLGASQHDPNGKVGRAWDGLWSKADSGIGMAGAFTVNSKFHDNDGFADFFDDDSSSVSSSMSTNSSSSTSSCSSSSTGEKKKKKIKKKKKKIKSKTNLSLSSIPSNLGLTSRHRILTTSNLTSIYRGTIYPTPVPLLISFLIPPFAEVTREEWDRSRVYNCATSMKHYRGLLARSVVTYITSIHNDDYADDGFGEIWDLNQVDLATKAMEGIGIFSPENRKGNKLNGNDKSQLVSTEELISSGKFMQSRRFAVAWLTNNLRVEFVRSSLDPILDSIQRAGKAGYLCEEVVVAPVTCPGSSSGITSGSNSSSIGGNSWTSGSGGLKCAIRCGRTFTSEQGLRQHLAALHAPPGTWLCRSCGSDCGTSQARTHHERYCATGGAPGGPNGGAISTVGQIGITAKQHGPGVGKQSGANSSNMQGQGAKNDPDKVDKDGSFRVPGYRGVWVNPAGKNFVKIQMKPYLENDSKKLFNSADEAAKFHDKIVKEKGLADIELNYKADGKTRIVYEDKSSMTSAGRGLEMLGGGASSVVPALSVINIKDLPKNVKPLLRDPKQTSRTGGNSKRYVYAYRGVCRQARKGHDRWQSQISFGGTNHYLGTFDSEWDAAAIYAWAHLILYGEEATRKAQREGEEAAAAWEQEKKDIAAGKIVASTKPTRKKKQSGSKPAASKKTKLTLTPDGKGSDTNANADNAETASDAPTKGKAQKRKLTKRDNGVISNGKNTGKKQSLMTLKDVSQKDDSALITAATERIFVVRAIRKQTHITMFENMAISVPVTSWNSQPPGWAMLVGLSARDFGWGMSDFISQFSDAEDLLDEESFVSEYGPKGTNVQFRCALQGTVCIMGRHEDHLDKASQSLGIGQVILGEPAGKVDCTIGGPEGCCSPVAARIDYCPIMDADYHFAACNDDDVVTLNGVQIKASMGSFPLHNEDICSVGVRVFMFCLPK